MAWFVYSGQRFLSKVIFYGMRLLKPCLTLLPYPGLVPAVAPEELQADVLVAVSPIIWMLIDVALLLSLGLTVH